jgi:predicted transcriptional regulator
MEALPYEFVSRLGELKNCSYIGNVMAVFQKIQEISDEADEYIWRVTDKRLNIIYPNIQKAADRGVEYLRIEPDVVNESPLIEIKPPVIPGSVRSIESIPVFMAISEKEVGGLAFPRLDGEFDYLGFTSKDPMVIKWCTDLFKHYWGMAKPKIFNYKQ